MFSDNLMSEGFFMNQKVPEEETTATTSPFLPFQKTTHKTEKPGV